MSSFGRSLLISVIALGLSTAALAQPKGDAGSGAHERPGINE